MPEGASYSKYRLSVPVEPAMIGETPPSGFYVSGSAVETSAAAETSAAVKGDTAETGVA